MVDLVINGDIVLHDQIMKNGALIIDQGKVLSIQSGGTLPTAKKVFDASELLVIPGCVDAQVHTFSTPGQSCVDSTSAAAAGGVTTFIDHPFDQPTGISTADEMKKKIAKIGEEALIDVALLGTVKKEYLDVIEPLAVL